MSKAILVMDMPEHCSQCPCYDSMYEMCLYKYKDIVNKTARPNWCPLKSLPEEDEKEYLLEWSRGYQGGWNDCIAAIMGE